MLWHVVEKDGFGTDWHLVRYGSQAVQRFESETKAEEAAKKYLTDANCNNALTKAEKLSGAEAFMMLKEGCFMGILDGDDWFVTYPKDIKGKDGEIKHHKSDKVQDSKYYELEGKTEVAVRVVPGT